MQFAKAIAVLPGRAVQRLSRIRHPVYGPTLQVTMYAGEIPGSPGAAGIAYSSSSGPYGVGLPNVVTLENDGSPVLRDGVARVLLHEFAHVLDNQIAVDAAGGRRVPDGERIQFSEGPVWQRAMSECPCAVSWYATTHASEDFAESVVAWFAFYPARV